MKTQIKNLINGCKDVCRMLEHPKYATAKQATSHIGYAGTNDKDSAETYRLCITGDCFVMVYKIKGSGKGNGYEAIDEAFITIE